MLWFPAGTVHSAEVSRSGRPCSDPHGCPQLPWHPSEECDPAGLSWLTAALPRPAQPESRAFVPPPALSRPLAQHLQHGCPQVSRTVCTHHTSKSFLIRRCKSLTSEQQCLYSALGNSSMPCEVSNLAMIRLNLVIVRTDNKCDYRECMCVCSSGFSGKRGQASPLDSDGREPT